MVQTSVDRALIVLALIYLGIALVGLLVVHATPTVLIPFIVVFTVFVIKKLRVFVPIAIVALTLALPALSIEGLYLSIPLSIAIPFLLKRFKPEEERQILGSTTIVTIKYMLLATPLILVNVRIIVVIAFTTSTAILASIISYVRLSKVRAEVVYTPDSTTLGKNASAILKISTPTRCGITISYNGRVDSFLAKGEVVFNIDLPSIHVGTNIVNIDIKAYDLWGFSGRTIERYSITYKVIPIAHRVIEVVEKELKSYSEIYGLIPSLEIAVLDLEQGIATLVRGKEVIRVLSEVIRKTRTPYAMAFLEHLKTLIEELLAFSSSVQRKSRYGEYIGVRPYAPGDYLRHIHWKKSVSKGMLVVKEFSLSSPHEVGGTGGRGLEPLAIVDLYAANTLELDKIIALLLRLCLNIFRSNPGLKLNILLILGNTAVVVKGKAVDILYKLYRFFKDVALQAMFSYTPIKYDEVAVEGIAKVEPKPKLLSMYMASGNTYAKKLLDLLLIEEIMPPKPFTIIHSDALIFRYSIAKHILSKYGFVYTSPEVMSSITSVHRVTEHGSQGRTQ